MPPLPRYLYKVLSFAAWARCYRKKYIVSRRHVFLHKAQLATETQRIDAPYVVLQFDTLRLPTNKLAYMLNTARTRYQWHFGKRHVPMYALCGTRIHGIATTSAVASS